MTRTQDAARKPLSPTQAPIGTSIEAPNASAAAAQAARSAVNQGESAAHAMAGQAQEAGQAVSESVSRTAEAAAELSRQAADQGRDAMLLGVRAAADAGYDRGHQVLASSAEAMNIYRDAAERSAAQVQAMFASCLTLGSGIQRMQHAWLEMMDNAMERARRRPQDLFRCSNLTEYAEVQRDIYLGTINNAFDASNTMLELAERATRDAMLPLRAQRDVSARM